MPKTPPNGGPDLLALAMRRARDGVAAGRVPKRPPDAEDVEPPARGEQRDTQA